MPTLSGITDGHSQRITRITRIRDDGLRQTADARDRRLRASPAAARLYDAFDAQLADATDRQRSTDAKAEAARAAALHATGDTLTEALAEAHRVRRDADVAAFEKRRTAEEDAEREFLLAIGAAAAAPDSAGAHRVRAEKVEKARTQCEAALAGAQERFRAARDAALIDESRASRDAGRAYSAAAKVSEASSKAARANAEQALAKALSALPEAAEAFAAWRTETAAILADYKRSENEQFDRFHQEVQALRG